MEKRFHILVADDELELCQTVATILEVNGYSVTTANDGQEALDIYDMLERRGERPDLLITDISMPEMNGVDLVKEVKKKNSTLAVLAISGCATKASAINMLRLGASDFLEKPFTTETLLSSVNSVIKRSSNQISMYKSSELDIRKTIHDFNNWLGTISGYAEMIKIIDDTLSPEEMIEQYQKYALKIKNAAELAVKTLQQIKYPDGHPISNELHILIKETITLQCEQLYPDVNFVYNFDATKSIVNGDATVLKNVFSNLILNAAQAMNDKGTITISSTNITIHTINFICITVIDTGCGISEEIRNRIFEPGFSTKEGVSRGFGLAASQDYIRKIKGSISVQSAPGLGSTFTVLLPVQ